jgi:TRAP-type transport system small permease protein
VTSEVTITIAIRIVQALNRALHYVAGALIIGVMAFTVYNVLGRWLFGAPLRGTVELTQLAMIGIVYLGLAYAQHQNTHISVDLLYRKFGRRVRMVVDGFVTLLSVFVLALVAWRLYEYAGVLEAGGRTTASRAIPMHPFAYVAIIGIVAFIIAFVATMIEKVRSARRGSESEAADSGLGAADTRWQAPL